MISLLYHRIIYSILDDFQEWLPFVMIYFLINKDWKSSSSINVTRVSVFYNFIIHHYTPYINNIFYYSEFVLSFPPPPEFL